MVTKKAILVVFCILSLVMIGCSKVVADLGMQRKPYFGTDLKIDGYYYSEPMWKEKESFAVAVFYRNGVSMLVFLEMGQSPERDFLLNESLISDMKSKPHSIGVFSINSHSLEMENFIGRGFRHTYKSYYEIINDSTFVMKRFIGIEGSESFHNLKFKFKKFSPKPDSASVYIR